MQNLKVKFVFKSEYQQPVTVTPSIYGVEYTMENFSKSVVPGWPIHHLFDYMQIHKRIYKHGQNDMYVDVTFDQFPKFQEMKFNETACGVMQRIKTVIEAINTKYPIVSDTQAFMLYDNGEFEAI